MFWRRRGEHVGRCARVIWGASVELAPKLKVTFVPGWAASNCLPSVVNASSSEAAANTVMFPGGRRGRGPDAVPPEEPGRGPGVVPEGGAAAGEQGGGGDGRPGAEDGQDGDGARELLRIERKAEVEAEVEDAYSA